MQHPRNTRVFNAPRLAQLCYKSTLGLLISVTYPIRRLSLPLSLYLIIIKVVATIKECPRYQKKRKQRLILPESYLMLITTTAVAMEVEVVVVVRRRGLALIAAHSVLLFGVVALLDLR